MYIIARVIAVVKHKEKIDRKCRILYHEYGAATGGRRLSHSLERGGVMYGGIVACDFISRGDYRSRKIHKKVTALTTK
jgi:hypothetical protein